MMGKKGRGARRRGRGRGCENFREGLGRKGGFGPLMGRLSCNTRRRYIRSVSIALNFRPFYLWRIGEMRGNFFVNFSFINTSV